MMLHFEKVGRLGKTFDVPVSSESTLVGLCEEHDFLRRQVSGCMRSDPDFQVSNDGTKIGIFAGFHLVGEAWFVKEGGNP